MSTLKKPGFEYTVKKTETPFETFLRYTNEKEQSAAKLAEILQKNTPSGARLLDIGAGNGAYLQAALSQAKLQSTQLNLLEPSADLIKVLQNRFKQANIIHSSLEDFTSDTRFNTILMSHMFYHLPRASWPTQLAKALSLLQPGGSLIIVLRDKDDAYDFKMAFKPLLFDPSFQALTLDDVLESLPNKETLRLTRHFAHSELHIPYNTNQADAITIIEFYLNKRWPDIPLPIQKSIWEFIAHKNGVLHQRDGIVVIEKP